MCGYTALFFHHFNKGKQLLWLCFSSQDDVTILKWIHSFSKEFVSFGSFYLLYDLNQVVWQNKCRVVSLERYPISHLYTT